MGLSLTCRATHDGWLTCCPHSATARTLLCHVSPRWRRWTGQIPVLSVVCLLTFSPVGHVCRWNGCHPVLRCHHGVDGLAHLPAMGAQAVAFCEPPTHPRRVHHYVSPGARRGWVPSAPRQCRASSFPTLRVASRFQEMGKLSRGCPVRPLKYTRPPNPYSLSSHLSASLPQPCRSHFAKRTTRTLRSFRQLLCPLSSNSFSFWFIPPRLLHYSSTTFKWRIPGVQHCHVPPIQDYGAQSRLTTHLHRLWRLCRPTRGCSNSSHSPLECIVDQQTSVSSLDVVSPTCRSSADIKQSVLAARPPALPAGSGNVFGGRSQDGPAN